MNPFHVTPRGLSSSYLSPFLLPAIAVKRVRLEGRSHASFFSLFNSIDLDYQSSKMSTSTSSPKTLIYLLRRDLRVSDNPILHSISQFSKQSKEPFTHLLPLYIFPSQQVEVSGFLSEDSSKSPFPEARSAVGGFWRCGPHRAKFLGESVWDVKEGLEGLGSGLVIRVGRVGEVVKSLMEELDGDAGALWMTSEEGVEEKREEREVRAVMKGKGAFKLWTDEKYFIDEWVIRHFWLDLEADAGNSRDIPFAKPSDLPDVFTTYRKSVEPLREAPRKVLPKPEKLLPLPSAIPTQAQPFTIPTTKETLLEALNKPLTASSILQNPPSWPSDSKSAHPFLGGENTGHARVSHLITSGSMTSYKDTRNEMVGQDFSTKLSAWLALGCITARQIHSYLLSFEDGLTSLGSSAQGYSKGENKGTAAVRFELLWRDYMRLCTWKFGPRLFRTSGFRDDSSFQWQSPSKDAKVRTMLTRFLSGHTGTGLIDASMRELFLTGYTSNRARQNVASFLAKHLSIDWRLGAEWYESLLVDYDVSSNWGNWQYTAGVGNDPRGEARVFNPVKQACDYDRRGEYVRTWVVELKNVEEPECLWQAWKIPVDKRAGLGLEGIEWVERPLKKIDFRVQKVGKGRTGGGRGGGGGGQGSGRGVFRGRGQGRGDRGGGGGGRGLGRTGMMDKANAGS
jgi:deoxyribodipyrimidine photo-lyase